MRLEIGLGQTLRRAFTLVEMLVVVALVILVMAILVSVFSATTGAVTTARRLQELDQRLRQLDGTIRKDLQGVTARLTPPLDPKDNLGYFEYGENAFADMQGEDTDDYLRFTTQAPAGQPFVGRVWNRFGNQNIQPIALTSQFAEIIYFLRDGGLYRRMLLIVPERQGSMGVGTLPNGGYNSKLYGRVGWLGMNDVSAHPARNRNFGSVPEPNTLGDLTNRENRYASPRFRNDFYPLASGGNASGDGIPDDGNLDGIPDYYPTLYPHVFQTTLINELSPFTFYPRITPTYDTMPFPYTFPGMFSKGDLPGGGAIHSLDSTGQTFNHAPLDLGDSLAIPTNSNQFQTWWGFPTWKETMSMFWGDPVLNVSDGQYLQGLGMSRLRPNFTLLPSVAGDFSDNAGSPRFSTPVAVWEDDLLLVGVRSFDVKAFDPNAKTFDPSTSPPTITSLGSVYLDLGYESRFFPGMEGVTPSVLLSTFGHEGRIPPLTSDFRSDPHWAPFWNRNLGDDDPSVLRLRRVFDTWSTGYTNAPDVPLQPLDGPPYRAPVYPSYPPPYPAPLRGIQIQIRVVDSSNEHVKVLTIRHDFSDRL